MYRVSKRGFDFLAALVGVVIFSPILLLVTILVRFSSKGPVIYRGERVGLHGKKFYILKFRSMIIDAEEGSATTSSKDPRITVVGRFLRENKLDELPQLFNVLGGSMSLVGPRPEVPSFVAKYTDAQQEILNAVPGITDLASLHFKDMGKIIDDNNPEDSYYERVWDKKNELRLQYVQNQSFAGDIVIIWKTIVAVISR